jgi:hypothetical protein
MTNGTRADAADSGCVALDSAQEEIDRGGHQRDEQHRPDVDDQHGGHVSLEVLIDLLSVAAGVEEQQHRPSQWHPDQEGERVA